MAKSTRSSEIHWLRETLAEVKLELTKRQRELRIETALVPPGVPPLLLLRKRVPIL